MAAATSAGGDDAPHHHSSGKRKAVANVLSGLVGKRKRHRLLRRRRQRGGDGSACSSSSVWERDAAPPIEAAAAVPPKKQKTSHKTPPRCEEVKNNGNVAMGSSGKEEEEEEEAKIRRDILLERCRAVLAALDEKVCGKVLTHLTESFSDVFRYVHETIMGTRPNRHIKDGYLHQSKIVECTFIQPSNNGDPLPHRVAMQRMLTYCCEIMILAAYTVYQEISDGDKNEDTPSWVYAGRRWKVAHCHHVISDPIHVGTIPQMVETLGCLLRSGEVMPDMDPHQNFPGFFVVSGTPKVMSPIERLCNNTPLLFEDPSSSYPFILEFRSSHHSKPHRSTSTFLMKMGRFHAKQPKHSHRVMVELPYVDEHFPLMVLLMALGWHQEDVLAGIKLALGDQFRPEFLPIIETMFYSHEGCVTQRDALLYISQRAKRSEPQAEKRIAFVLSTLRNELMPHMGYHAGASTEKGMMLNDLFGRLAMFAKGHIKPSDRDDTKVKVFDNAAIMLASLIRQLWRLTTKKSERSFADQIEKDKTIDMTHQFNGRNITPRVISCMSTGNWSAKKGANKVRSNVTQPMIQMNEMAKLAHLMRVASVHSSECTNEKRRQIARNSYKRICPSETPEGATCGLVKHLALGAHISTGSCPMTLMRVLFAFHAFVPLHEWKKIVAGTAKAGRGTRQWVQRLRTPPATTTAAASSYQRQQQQQQNNKKKRKTSKSGATSSTAAAAAAAATEEVSTEALTLARDDDAAALRCSGNKKRRRASSSSSDKSSSDDEQQQRENCEDDSTACNGGGDGGEEDYNEEWVKIFVNGVWSAWLPRMAAAEFVESVRSMRRKLQLDSDVTVVPLPALSEIRINCESGKILRPLALPDAIFRPPETLPPSPMYTLQCMQAAGLIEYVDAAEEETLRIAHTADEFLAAPPGTFTHCEISPDHLFGVSVGCIPYAPHNQCCRCTYQAAMGKQAQQVWASRPRGEATTFTMDYGQKPLVYTHTARQLGMDQVMSGLNVRICMACYEGYNIEDSIIMNQSLVDMGGFISSETKRFKDEQKKHGSSSNCEYFEQPRPETTRCLRDADYSKLDRDGLAASSTIMGESCIVIGKTAPNHSISQAADAHVPKSMEANSATAKRRDVSVGLRKGEAGTVVQTLMTYGRNPNLRTVTVLVRLRRIPMMGDKFSCYTPDHQLLTTKGWVPVADVKQGDVVASFDPETQQVSYEPVEAVHAYQVKDEPLYEVDTQQVSLKTTLNHNMYVNKGSDGGGFKLVQAQHVSGKRNVRFLKNAPEGLPKEQCWEPPCPVPTTTSAGVRAFLFLFGLWVGTGNGSSSTSSDGSRRVTIQAKSVALKRRILEAAERCGLPAPSVCTSSSSTSSFDIHFEQHKQPLVDFLLSSTTTMNANNASAARSLPEWCFHLTKAQSASLLQGLVGSSSSTKSRHSAWRYCPSSEQLKDDAQKLALHAGYSATAFATPYSATTPPAQEKASSWQVVYINRCGGKNEPLLNGSVAAAPSSPSTKQQSERIAPWTGTVHCVTVRTGIVYLRRNGKAVWCGNSRHGQKGTVGRMMPDEDMPFNRHGSVSIIINPHCLPSRKTVGHLVEAIVAVAGCYDIDVPLEVRSIGNDMPLTVELVGRVLRAFGMAPTGKEQFQNGRTGEMISGHLFTGLIYYQRLKHMVDDKKHARGLRGPKQIQNRQPREGRIRMGGLRFGYMEGDVLYAHGAAQMHQERLTTFSDEFNCYVCHLCGFIGEYNPAQNMYYCRHCDKNDTLWQVQMPYSFKLVLQEMMGNGCVMRLKLQQADGDPSIWCPEAKATHPQLFRFQGSVVEEEEEEEEEEESNAFTTSDSGAMPPPANVRSAAAAAAQQRRKRLREEDCDAATNKQQRRK